MPASTSVPLAKRMLAAHPSRTVARAAAIGTALTLMLLLAGLWAGVQAHTTLFEDHARAPLAVVAPGTDSLFAQPSVLPAAAVDRVAGTPGVVWAAPVRTTYLILDVQGRRSAVALVGAQPGRAGSPWRIASGRAPRRAGEVVVDRLFAQRERLRTGDRLRVVGTSLRIVGLSDDTSMFMTPLVFVTERQAAALLHNPGSTGAVLVGTAHTQQVAQQLRAAGFTVRTLPQLRLAALRLATRIFGAPLKLMVAVAFVAGTLIVALVAHMLVAEQRRDLGVLKALGAPSRRLVAVTVCETLGLTALGAVFALVLFGAAQALVAWWRPQFPVLFTLDSALSVALAAVAMTVIAAVLPARRVGRLDAAAAFRSGP